MVSSGNKLLHEPMLTKFYHALWCHQGLWINTNSDKCKLQLISRVSCEKGPTRHAYTWQIGPFCQDTLDILRTFGGWPYIQLSQVCSPLFKEVCQTARQCCYPIVHPHTIYQLTGAWSKWTSFCHFFSSRAIYIFVQNLDCEMGFGEHQGCDSTWP